MSDEPAGLPITGFTRIPVGVIRGDRYEVRIPVEPPSEPPVADDKPRAFSGCVGHVAGLLRADFQ
jgi:hypothetical protein